MTAEALRGRTSGEAGLAVHGGPPVRASPVPTWPSFDADDIAAVGAVLASGRVNYWTGEEGRRFEDEFASWAGARHAVAVSNGTVALELALHAIGVGPGDEVVVPAATFIATASAVIAVGATPVVADIDPDSLCLSAATVEGALSARTVAVIVVHLAGWPVDMAPIVELAARCRFRVVEDCAQAHGAERSGRPVGSSGDVAAWSFCQDKIMTTAGEGGAITTDDPEIWRRCWERKDHGKSWNAVHRPDHPAGFRWLHESFGTNARLSEVQSAVGRRQLRKVPEWSSRRRGHAALLRRELDGVDALTLPDEPPDARHAWYRFWLRVHEERLAPGWNRDRLVSAVSAEGVPCSHGGCAEIHREKAFGSGGRVSGPTPVAELLGRTSLVLLVHPTLSESDVRDVATAVRKVVEVAS